MAVFDLHNAVYAKTASFPSCMKRVRRRTIQKQDRSVWSLWEESHSQFSVVHKMWKLGSWQMCKNKNSYY